MIKAHRVEVAELNRGTVLNFLAWRDEAKETDALKEFENNIGKQGFVSDIEGNSRGLNGLDPDTFKDTGPVTANWTTKGQLYMVDGSHYRPR